MRNRSRARFTQLGIAALVAVIGAGCATKKTEASESSADLEAHLANQKALRDRLRDALERAQKVDELLMVERELARVQAEIDRVEGHRARVRTSVAQSTISLALCAEPEPAPQPKRRILGPLGAAWWVVQKLWVVRE